MQHKEKFKCFAMIIGQDLSCLQHCLFQHRHYRYRTCEACTGIIAHHKEHYPCQQSSSCPRHSPLLKRKREGWHKKAITPADGRLSFWIPIPEAKMLQPANRKGLTITNQDLEGLLCPRKLLIRCLSSHTQQRANINIITYSS